MTRELKGYEEDSGDEPMKCPERCLKSDIFPGISPKPWFRVMIMPNRFEGGFFENPISGPNNV